jgi:DNA uptake protein ComE-like DNA-binding protein
MKFKKFLKQWLGYSRRERTGSMVLLFILLSVLVIRTIKTGGSVEDDRVELEAPPSQAQVYSVRQSSKNEGGNPGNRSFAKDGSVPYYGGQSKAEDSTHGSYYLPFRGSIDSEYTSSITNRKIIGQIDGTGKEMSNSELRSTFSDRINISNPKLDFVDINRADSAELEALPGIGPVLSVRIIKYRYLIGYFYSIDQLNDVYGLDRDVIEMNRTRLKCDSSMVRKININDADYSDMLRHPYINRSQVEAIITYRRLYGSFTDIAELRHNRIFDNDQITRLRPYLEL